MRIMSGEIGAADYFAEVADLADMIIGSAYNNRNRFDLQAYIAETAAQHWLMFEINHAAVLAHTKHANAGSALLSFCADLSTEIEAHGGVSEIAHSEIMTVRCEPLTFSASYFQNATGWHVDCVCADNFIDSPAIEETASLVEVRSAILAYAALVLWESDDLPENEPNGTPLTVTIEQR